MERIGAADVHWTTGPGDAFKTAREQAGERPLLVALGGDGTVSEVGRGISGSGAAAELGVLPFGTGNDFARAVGIRGRNALKAVAGAAVPTDLGVVRFTDQPSRHFLNSLSVGLAADVNRRTYGRRKFGRKTYLMDAVREAVGYRAATFRIGLDGEDPRPRTLVNASFMNTRCFGGGIPITPGADPGDGRLDLALVGTLSFVGWMDTVRRLASGTHFDRRELERHLIRRASVQGTGRIALEVDGELVETSRPFEISVAPAAIQVRRPA